MTSVTSVRGLSESGSGTYPRSEDDIMLREIQVTIWEFP